MQILIGCFIPTDYRDTLLLTVVNTSVILAFVLLGLLLMACLRCCCKNGRLGLRRGEEHKVISHHHEEAMDLTNGE